MGRRGAGPMYSFEMARALSKEHDVLSVISSRAENISLWREESSANARFSIYEVSTYSSLSSFIFKTLNFFQYSTIAKRINEFAPDILYSPFGQFWEKFIYPMVKCRVKVKTYHDMNMHEGEDKWYLGLLYSAFSFRTDKCVVLSDVFVDTVMEKYGYDRENVIVIPHASFQEYSRDKTLDLDTKYGLMFFGRLVKYKGLSVLLEALRTIVREIPEIKLYIVGNGDISENSKDIEELKEHIELHNRWIKDEEVESFFRQTDIAIMPYIEASQSGVIPLANSFGKPSIATALGGLPAQIDNNVTGIVIEPNNPTMLAQEVIKLYKNPERLHAMKKSAWEYSKSNNWDKSAKLLIDGCKS